MKPYLVGALLLIGVVAWSCRENQAWKDWEQDKATTLASVKAREDSAERMLTLGMRLLEAGDRKDSLAQAQSFRAERTYRNALRIRDSLESLAIPDTCLPLARGWRRANDSLKVGYDSLKVAFDSLMTFSAQRDTVERGLLEVARLRKVSIDSLQALVGRVPRPKKWVPVVTVGYGAVLSNGVVRTGPSAQVGFRVPF